MGVDRALSAATAPRLDIRWVRWAAIRDSILPLWQQHNAEIAAPADQSEFDPDWDKFDAMATLNQDHWVVATNQGELVGYVFVIVTTHLHRKSTLSGFWDLYWLRPDMRKGLNGLRLLKKAERSLWARGVVKQYAGTKFWMDVGPLFERMGWEETERLFTKRAVK